MSKTYHIQTYGCQMNVADSELVESILIDQGYLNSNDPNNADAIFINTCSIREHAEDKVHSQLGRYELIKKKRPNVIIGVLGCMAQSLKHDLLEKRSFVDIILGPDSYRRLPVLLKRSKDQPKSLVDTTLSRFEVYDDLFPSRKEGINAWISIMRGCDKFCTFCIVPFTRGRERNRSIKSIIQEVKNAVKLGFVEITLLGQNVNSYRTEYGSFPELLETVAKVRGVKRIRYTSPHPQDIDDLLLQVMRDNHNICNYIHLPLQSGDNRILKRMNRTYSREKYLDLVNRIRNYIPNCSITTDIIVGFPGETEEEFKATLDIMKKVNFDSAFMFKYSARPGTKAVEYSDQIRESVKQRRLESVIELQKKITLIKNKMLIGKKVQVLVEKESKKSSKQWAGRTDGNTWVIFNKTNENIKDIVDVIINDAHGVTLFGNRLFKKEFANEVN